MPHRAHFFVCHEQASKVTPYILILRTVGDLEVAADATLGSSSSDTFTVMSSAALQGPVTAASSVLVGDSLTVHGDATLGSSAGGQALTINAVTTFSSTAGPVTANAAVMANQGLTLTGSTALNGNTVIGSVTGRQMLTINAVTTFAASAGPITANAPVIANADVQIRGLVNASGDAVLGLSSEDSLTVNAAAAFAELLQLNGEWPSAGSFCCNMPCQGHATADALPTDSRNSSPCCVPKFAVNKRMSE